MSDAFESYKLYHAIRTHFTSPTYSYFRYKGQTFASKRGAQFDKQKDKFAYYQLYKKYKSELRDFYVAIFSSGCKFRHVSELKNDEYHEIYTEWVKRQQSISYVFRLDMEPISELIEDRGMTIKSMLLPDGDNLPVIIRLYQQDFITLETVCIINMLTRFVIKCNIPKSNEWNDLSLKIRKLEPFIRISDTKEFAIMLRNCEKES